MREALEFYAAQDSYHWSGEVQYFTKPKVLSDEGRLAAKTLADVNADKSP